MKRTLSRKHTDQLAALAKLPDDEINTADIPEAPAENWRFARRGEFYRPLKQPVTIRIDADVLAWFRARAESGGYQTEINRVLRKHVEASENRARKKA